MGTLLQCSTLHVKENVIPLLSTWWARTAILSLFFQGLLISCNQMSADYLFQRDKHYDVCFDTGDKVIQCGRHNDIFKLWLMWRSKVLLWSSRLKGFHLFIAPIINLREWTGSVSKLTDSWSSQPTRWSVWKRWETSITFLLMILNVQMFAFGMFLSAWGLGSVLKLTLVIGTWTLER